MDYFKKNIGNLYAKRASENIKSSGIDFTGILIVVSLAIGVIYNYFKKIKQGNTQDTPKEEEKNNKQEDSGSEKKEEGWWVKPVQYIVVIFIFVLAYIILGKMIKSLNNCVDCSFLSFCA